MTLRRRTLIATGAALLGTLLVVYALSAVVLMKPFAELEEEAARRNVERARDALSEQVSNLSTIAADYATWDDTYKFILDLNQQYARVNLVPETFLNLRLNLMVFVDARGRVAYAEAFELKRRKPVPIPEGLLEQVAPGKPLVTHQDPTASVSGLLLLPAGPMLVASRPIVTSNGKGPIRGALIMAQWLDGRVVQEIGDITHLSVMLLRYRDPKAPADFRAAASDLSPSRPIVVRRPSNDLTFGYLLLSDIYQQPVAMLRTQAAYEIYQQGHATVRYLLVVRLLTGLAFGGVVILLMERWVLSRLARLSSRVAKIAASGDPSARVSLSGSDELSGLAHAINAMLAALDRSQHDLQESEERYRAFVEQGSAGVWRLELERPLPIGLPEEDQIAHLYRWGYVAECNETLAQLHGYARAADLEGVKLRDFLRPSDPHNAEQLRTFIRGGYRLSEAVSEHVDAHGHTRSFLNHLVGQVANDSLVSAWGMQPDITELRRAEALLRMQTSAINAASDQIIITDPDGRIEFINPAFERESGLAFSEIAGRSLRFLRPDHHKASVPAEFWEAIRTGSTWQGEIISRRKDGSIYTVDSTLTPVKNDQGAVEHFVAINRSVTEKRIYEGQLDHLAHHDSLTGLPNRLLLGDRLARQLTYAARGAAACPERSRGKQPAQPDQRGHLLAVMFLDLDHFKFINDTLGHTVGDTLLKLAAERLSRSVRDADTIARTGGDEFTVIASGIGSSDDAGKVAQRILDAFSYPFRLEGQEFFVTVSIGISLYPADGADVDTLIKHADTAMYRAKEMGRNNYQFFTRALTAAAVERVALEGGLRKAQEREELLLLYQPRVDVALGPPLGAEALLRWRHPDRGILSPTLFIPVAEETGLIVPITEWVLRTALAQNKAWQSQGLPPISVEVNISGRQFQQPNLIASIESILQETGLDPHHLGLEVTESALTRHPDLAVQALHRLKAMGISLLIDDFGTGHSSLNYLKRFPVDGVKIDRSFVANVTTSPDDAAIASAIVAMAHSLNLTVIAEGVETQAQLDFLRDIGCDQVQGFLISPPVSAEELAEYLRACGASGVTAAGAVELPHSRC